MNFSVHLDEQTAAALKREARRLSRTRNSLVAEAIRAWLERVQPTAWPKELLDFEGCKDLEPFEDRRRGGPQKARFP
ncbi:MAG: ribbon-helix-helix domain-containing protein [Myxococcota bacterium]